MTSKDLEIIKKAIEVLNAIPHRVYVQDEPNSSIILLLESIYNKYNKKAIKVIKETEAQKFVKIFSAVYRECCGYPYRLDNKSFILATKLIKDHGFDDVKDKMQILAFYCRDAKQWFVRDGWACFTIETLSARWNNILPIIPLTTQEKNDINYKDELKKWEAHDEAINKAIERS